MRELLLARLEQLTEAIADAVRGIERTEDLVIDQKLIDALSALNEVLEVVRAGDSK